MITNLSLKNFKGYESSSFDLRKITLFLGPNNSGKSAAMSAVRLLAQTVESYDRQVPLLLNGKYGDFGTYKDLVYGNGVRKQIGVSIGVQDSRVDPSGRRSPKTTLILLYKFNSAKKQVILRSVNVVVGEVDSATFEYLDDAERFGIQSLLGKDLSPEAKSLVNRRLTFFHFLPNQIFFSHEAVKPKSISEAQLKAAEGLQSNLRGIYSALTTMDYLSALRRAPSRTYAYSGEQHVKVGASGENAMSILAMDALVRGKRGKMIRDGVVDWLTKAGMADGIFVSDLAGRFFELQVRHPRTGSKQNIADVGFGISQVLPVLVGGLNSRPNSTFLVEEPEIHLHPRAQAELGDFFVDLAGRGVQSIIETHSEHLVLRLLQHVAAGEIASEDVIFYSVNGADSGCGVSKIEVNEKGVFVGDWPSGFFPERLEEAKKLAAARAGIS